MVTWRCTRRCVGNCLYCSYTPPKKPEEAEVNTKLAYKIVDEVHNFGSPWFGISGGEPLVREDIFDVIGYAKKLGFEVSLITSGFAFDEKRLNNLVRNEVHTAVSIDGNRESNDKIRGKGSYDKALFAMKKLSENGILDCIVTTMTKYNIKEMATQLNLQQSSKQEWLSTIILFLWAGQAQICLIWLLHQTNMKQHSTRYMIFK